MDTIQHVTTLAPDSSQAIEKIEPHLVRPEHIDNEFDTLLANVSAPKLGNVIASEQNEFTAQQFSQFYQYIQSHPEAIPAQVLAAIGEVLILDLANEASIRGRTELDVLIKENPHLFLFINTYIDRIGIAFGKRWVADKDINLVVAELKIAQNETKSRPMLKRLWDAACNNDTSVVSSLSEEVETLFAQRLALQTDVTQLTAKKAALESEILRTTQEQQLKLLQEHRSMVSEQIERQDAVAKELRAMQDEISRLQQRKHDEMERHLEQIRQIKEETRSLLSARDLARTEYRQARGESDIMLPSDSEKQRFVAGAELALTKIFSSELSKSTTYWMKNAKQFLYVATLFTEIEQNYIESLPEVIQKCKQMATSDTWKDWNPIFSDVLMGKYTMSSWLEEKRPILLVLNDLKKGDAESASVLWPGRKNAVPYGQFQGMYNQAFEMLFAPMGSTPDVNAT
jgi:hypothetical protein